MLSSNVLVLNRSYIPIHITSVRRAFCLMYQGLARVVDGQFETFDFESWSELSASVHDETVGLVGRMVRVPRVILLTAYDRIPRRVIRFSRLNVYLRDNNTCQYCGQKMNRSELNLDHVIPRMQGGKTLWDNVVACCFDCNRRKGGRRPEEASMHLIRHPVRPKWTPFIDFSMRQILYEEWRPFFNIVDFTYWNLELKPD
ncbi:MAG: HNH endonuclease [Deltaproteobacteria bacterium]|nr:HNH endonuclease [Deltaproteobacteria bacterium]